MCFCKRKTTEGAAQETASSTLGVAFPRSEKSFKKAFLEFHVEKKPFPGQEKAFPESQVEKKLFEVSVKLLLST